MSYIKPREIFMNYLDIEQIRVIISLIRVQNGHTYDSELIDKIKYRYNYPMLRNKIFQQAFKSVFQVDITREHLVDIACPIVSENLALDQDELIEFCENSALLKIDHQHIKILINNISEAVDYKLPVDKQESLILELMNTRLSTIRETYLIYNHKQHFLIN